MRTPRWVFTRRIVASVGLDVDVGVIAIVLFDTKIASIYGMALALGSFDIGVPAPDRVDRITKTHRAEFGEPC